MSDTVARLPTWAQWLQFGATLFIALAATRIAYGQWRTAHQRVLLDLFERRMTVYDAMRDVIGEIARSGRADDGIYYRYLRATDRVRLLFGDEIFRYSEAIREHIIQLALHSDMVSAHLNGEPIEDHASHVKGKAERLKAVLKFYEEFPKLVEPYVRMAQRNTSLWELIKPL